MNRALLVGGIVLTAAAIIGTIELVPDPAPPPAPVATVSTVSDSERILCREYGKATLAMADGLDRQFRTHANAHRDYKAGKITQEQVFEIWGRTLHDGRMHSGHFRDLAKAWRKGCLAET